MAKINRFDKRLHNIPADIWSLIAKIDELKGRWAGGINLNPAILGQLKKSVLVTSTGASTRIEGAKLSDADVEKLMRGIALQKFTDRDIQEVKGYFELLKNVFDSWRSLTFSESLIKHFHKELLKWADKDKHHRGNYKQIENKVQMIDREGRPVGILFDTTPVYLTPIKMAELTDWTKEALVNKRYHPLLTIGNFIVEFLNIHPFTDGNGRLSRILTNLLLLKAGYLYMPFVSHEKLIEQNKTDYYLSLRKSQKTFNTGKKDIAAWLKFFLNIILSQSKMAVDLLSMENVEKTFSPKQLAVWNFLGTVKETTPLEISKKARIARPTVNQILTKFLKLKLIERIGLGRSTRYRILN